MPRDMRDDEITRWLDRIVEWAPWYWQNQVFSICLKRTLDKAKAIKDIPGGWINSATAKRDVMRIARSIVEEEYPKGLVDYFSKAGLRPKTQGEIERAYFFSNLMRVTSNEFSNLIDDMWERVYTEALYQLGVK